MITVTLVSGAVGIRLAHGIQVAICRLLEVGGLDAVCDAGTGPSRPSGAVRDPDEPITPCVAGMESAYLEETLTVPTKRIDVRTNSRGTVQLIEKVGPDGRRFWDVMDFTWGEAGVSSPEIGDSKFKYGVWGGLDVTNGKGYRFTDEAAARAFLKDLTGHRIGNAAKFTVRTNPITGGLSWLLGKIPKVGKAYDRWIGGSEPDGEAAIDYVDGGITGGGKGELDLGPVKFPFKGRGWWVQGTQNDRESGQKTTYVTQRGEAEIGVSIDLASIWRGLPKGVEERAAAGMDDALDLAMTLIVKRLGQELGDGFVMPPRQRAEIKKAIRVNPSGGLNYKHRGGATASFTVDRQGRPVRLVRTSYGQDVVYFRADGKAKVDGEGVRAEATAGRQWIIHAQRTQTDRALSYSDPADRKVIEEYGRTGDERMLDAYFAVGGGTMSRLTYDNTGETEKEEAKGGTKGAAKGKRRSHLGVYEVAREREKHTVQSAEYYKPDRGWVPWTRCH
ncbi:hypothetical protein [Spirillospora sp. NBC_01491]|uniref:hypothetical protein n=1 Tax=Spirillospora sp. NBC_01491 TaxID=2976007 RepID=UPI002E319B93|nr:hypothetical protein [Spirillospora sp. NBC_01491]